MLQSVYLSVYLCVPCHGSTMVQFLTMVTTEVSIFSESRQCWSRLDLSVLV